VDDPAFAPADGPFSVHTRWIETEWLGSPAASKLEPWAGAAADADVPAREVVVVEVNGRRLEVSLPAGLGAATATPAPRRTTRRTRAAEASGDDLTAPMQGTVVTVAVANGGTVAAGDLVLVLEAMKMEQPIVAHKAGTVSGLAVTPGGTVTAGAVICAIT
jgi:acetyl-CoA/propionyl-CoA carboxylase biotin carboxyl carrier protein